MDAVTCPNASERAAPLGCGNPFYREAEALFGRVAVLVNVDKGRVRLKAGGLHPVWQASSVRRA